MNRLKFSLACFLALLFSCHDQPPPKVVFVLFDLSGSTRSAEVRQKYLTDYQKILTRINPGDRLIVDYISENPLAQSSFPVNWYSKPFNMLEDSKLKFEHEMKLDKDQALDTVRAILFDLDKKIGLTKIREALQLAERVFQTYAAERKVLVLFSDMVEESPEYNFLHIELNDSRIDQIIAADRKANRLPGLERVAVYVVGAAAGGYEKLTQKKYMDIQKFWIKYFSACDADLSKKHYGSTLLEFVDQ